MVNIPLLEPMALTGVIREMETPENLVLSNTVSRTSTPFPSVTWDIVRGTRTVARPNVPNSEAHIVNRHGRAQKTASLIYLREKKTFLPTTLYWIREVGQLGNLQNAENAILEEAADLRLRFDNYVEWTLWQALTGTLVINDPTVQGSYDFEVRDSHKPTPATGWDTATPMSIVSDVQAWMSLVSRDTRQKVTDAWCTPKTIQLIFNSWVNSQGDGAGLLSDTMKTQYYQTGVLPGFLGLNWHVVDGQYDTAAGDIAQFCPDNALYLTTALGSDVLQVVEGPTADDQAPRNFTGFFSKSWIEPDPSARQILLEYNFAPILKKPDNVIYVSDVTAGA